MRSLAIHETNVISGGEETVWVESSGYDLEDAVDDIGSFSVVFALMNAWKAGVTFSNVSDGAMVGAAVGVGYSVYNYVAYNYLLGR